MLHQAVNPLAKWKNREISSRFLSQTYLSSVDLAMTDLSGGTAVPGTLNQQFFDLFGRMLALRVLAPGAGEGPTQGAHTVLGELFSRGLEVAITRVAEVSGISEEEALCKALDIGKGTYRDNDELAATAAFVVAARAGVLGTDSVEALPPTPNDSDFSPQERRLGQLAGLNLPESLGVAAWTLKNVSGWLCPRAAEELPEWARRAALAKAISLGGVAAETSLGPFLTGVDRFEGSSIHEHLARRFARSYGPDSVRRHDILIERTVHARSRRSTLLSDARPWGPKFQRLWLAFKSPKHPKGHLRLDLADLTLMNVWEVKPVDGMAQGVAQLWFYTGNYNCRAQQDGSAERLLVTDQKLDTSVMLPIPLGKRDGRLRFAVPFQLKELPGLLSYVAVALPSPHDVTNAATLDLMSRLEKELRKLLGLGRRPALASPGIAGSADPMVWFIAVAAILVVSLGPAAIASLGALRAVTTGVVLTAAAASAEPLPTDDSGQTPSLQGKLTVVTFAGAVECGTAEEFFVALGALTSIMLLH